MNMPIQIIRPVPFYANVQFSPEPSILEPQQPSAAEYAYAQALKKIFIKIPGVRQDFLSCWKIFRFEDELSGLKSFFKTLQELGSIDKKIDFEHLNPLVMDNLLRLFQKHHEEICLELYLDPKTFRLEHSFLNMGSQMFGLALHDELGEGGFGQVKHCWDAWGNLLAYKAEKGRSRESIEEFKRNNYLSDRAATAAGQLIASGYRASDTKKKFFSNGLKELGGSRVLKKITVMNLAKGVNVREYLSQDESFDKVKFLIIFYRMMQALLDLHSKNILHLDTKIENFQIDDDCCVTLVDFGFSLVLEPDQKFITLDCSRGTYRALEVMSDKLYCRATDIYSVAVSLFGGASYHSKVKRQERPLIDAKIFSLALQGAIKKMKNTRPEERPNAQLVCDFIVRELYHNHLEDRRVESFFQPYAVKKVAKYEDLTVGPTIADTYLEECRVPIFAAPIISYHFIAAQSRDIVECSTIEKYKIIFGC